MSYQINKFNSPQSRNLSRSKDNLSQLTSSDQFKQKVLSQNKALAKKNSILMTKVADLEIKISELIQQNIELRAIKAKSEDQKRKWLEEKLNIIESGVSQRFEEMFQMFATLRSNEGLAASTVNTSNVIQNVSHDSSDKTVSFQNIKSPSRSNINERRRKSARRQSIYIPPPPSPPQQQEKAESQSVEEVEQLPSEFDAPSIFQDEASYHEQNFHEDEFENQDYLEHSFQEPLVNDEFIAEEEEETEVNEQREIDHAITLSPIKFSSPKRPGSHPKFSVYTESDDKELPDKEGIDLKIKKLAEDSVKMVSRSEDEPEEQEQQQDNNDVNIIDFSEFKDKAGERLYQNVDKIKHTKSKKQKQKSSNDEHMPEPMASSEVLSTRKSRRGKSVNYAEPSLRKKMRRESEQLTDAVVDSDFQIKREVVSQPQSLTKQTIDQGLLQASRDSPIKQNIKSSPQVIQVEAVEERTKPTPLIEKDSRNITKRRKPLGTLNQNKVQKKDSKPFKKMQLDIDAAELSVFDLVDECEVGVPKMYKGDPDVTDSIKKSSRKATGSRRHSMML